MAKAVDVVSGRPQHVGVAGVGVAVEMGAAICSGFRDRIGADRYGVWFGDALDVIVTEGGRLVTLRVGTMFTHDWIRRTFQADLEQVVRGVCGPAARLSWLTAAENQIGCDPESGHPESSHPESSHPESSHPESGEPKVLVAPRSRRKPTARAAKDTRSMKDRPAKDKPPSGPGQRPADRGEFVPGVSNRMAFSAIERVAVRPGEMSPLVIHGPSGVGKTHLLEAVCARIRDLHRGITVVSLSAEQFTTGFLQALHGGGLPGFRRSCRSADLLVIDDIQFLAGKRATTLEFQHTVDALHRLGRQMVFACDRELDALPGLGADVLTRLRGGMTARIEPPDYEVRRGIVAQFCTRRGLVVPDEVVHYVATHITRHAREIYGAVNRLEAASLMLGVPITAGMAEEALADLVRSSGRSIRLADIEQAVCKAFGIEAGMLQSGRRSRSASHPRMLAMFLARKHTHAALADIGRYFGRRSHSTVIAAQKTVGDWVTKRANVLLAESQWDVEEAIRRVEDMLRAG
jgi:chromosomal replication initiator protein